MMTQEIALTLLLTVLPISELRGGIPLGISLGLDPLFTFFIAVIANALMFFPIFFGLRLFYDKLLSRIPLFNKYLDSVRKRGKPKVDKYGFWGLTFFVALPLPITGVYTGTALAWLLGMDWRKAFPPIGIGVIIAGVIVLLGALGVVEVFDIFVKS
ncbi:MAG: ligand-binding protein SH3 [Dehalococcoidia bacterium]|nr:MAG: ligand-binding protein SH3 [Dehalococcoidia bacterium]